MCSYSAPIFPRVRVLSPDRSLPRGFASPGNSGVFISYFGHRGNRASASEKFADSGMLLFPQMSFNCV